MKKILFNVSVFCKRPGIFSRLIILGIALFATFTIFIPDLKFNLEIKNPKTYTIEELQKTSKENLPRYIVVKDAQAMQASQSLGVDSVDGSDIKLMSYNYVIQQRVKKGDTSLSYILYPVYSKAVIAKSADTDAASITSYVVMKDAHVTEKELEGDKYFSDSAFSINGKFDGDVIDEESHKILSESGYKVSKDAIILERGNTPMSLTSSIILTLVALLISALVILSLLPLTVLHKMFDVEQEIVKI